MDDDGAIPGTPLSTGMLGAEPGTPLALGASPRAEPSLAPLAPAEEDETDLRGAAAEEGDTVGLLQSTPSCGVEMAGSSARAVSKKSVSISQRGGEVVTIAPDAEVRQVAVLEDEDGGEGGEGEEGEAEEFGEYESAGVSGREQKMQHEDTMAAANSETKLKVRRARALKPHKPRSSLSRARAPSAS